MPTKLGEMFNTKLYYKYCIIKSIKKSVSTG